MTKKDYIAIAEVIRGADFYSANISNLDYRGGFEAALGFVSQKLIKVFEEDNPRFDREIFLRACGL